MNPKSIDVETTVAALVLDRPSRARVFEHHGIDYCCHGDRSLAEAAAADGADLGRVLAELADSDTRHDQEEPEGVHGDGVEGLVGHILDTHHAYLHEELPRIDSLLTAVVAAHAERHPEVAELHDVYRALRGELEAHLAREETEVFPAVLRASTGRARPETARARAEALARAVTALSDEHDRAGAALERMRRLSGGYTPPDDACPTYVATMHALAAFEADTHRHVHLENNVLFPALADPAERIAG